MKQNYIIIFLVAVVISLSADFDIARFSDPQKYQWKNFEEQQAFRQDLLERQKLLQIYELKKQDVTSNLVKSALVPGWGHFSAQHYNKGSILMATEVVLFGTGFFYLDKAMDSYSNYKDATYIGDIKQFYTDANDEYRMFQGFMSLGLLVWCYTIYDTIVVTDEYNAAVWNRILQDSGKRISLGMGTVSVRF